MNTFEKLVTTARCAEVFAEEFNKLAAGDIYAKVMYYKSKEGLEQEKKVVMFTGNRLRDLLLLVKISIAWSDLYGDSHGEKLDIVGVDSEDGMYDEVTASIVNSGRTDNHKDKDGWIEWKGGECPIPDAKAGECEVRFRCDKTNNWVAAIHWQWEHSPRDGDYNIVAYRLVKPDHSQFANSETTPTGCNTAAGAADAPSSQTGLQPDWSTAPAWANYWAADYSGRSRWYQYEPQQCPVLWAAIGNNKAVEDRKLEYPVSNWDKTLQQRPHAVSYQTPDGFYDPDMTGRSFYTFRRIRIARRDKSYSEGYWTDFDWNPNLGLQTIIGWKYV